MTLIKARAQPVAMLATMRVSYELYLRRDDGHRRLELVACETPQEAMEIARSRLEADDLESIEVRLGGELLFTMSR